MMNPNVNLLIDIALLFGGVAYTFTLLQLRSKRESLLSPHKPDSEAYKSIKASLSSRRLVIVVAATVLVMLKTAFDVRAIMRTEGEPTLNTIIFISALAIVLLVAIVIAVYRKYKQ